MWLCFAMWFVLTRQFNVRDFCVAQFVVILKAVCSALRVLFGWSNVDQFLLEIGSNALVFCIEHLSSAHTADNWQFNPFDLATSLDAIMRALVFPAFDMTRKVLSMIFWMSHDCHGMLMSSKKVYICSFFRNSSGHVLTCMLFLLLDTI